MYVCTYILCTHHTYHLQYIHTYVCTLVRTVGRPSTLSSCRLCVSVDNSLVPCPMTLSLGLVLCGCIALRTGRVDGVPEELAVPGEHLQCS